MCIVTTAVILHLIYKLWSGTGPIPEVENSNVKEVNNLEEFNKVLQSAKANSEHVVVDFYATWCPPCRYVYDSVYFNKSIVTSLSLSLSSLSVCSVQMYVHTQDSGTYLYQTLYG